MPASTSSAPVKRKRALSTTPLSPIPEDPPLDTKRIVSSVPVISSPLFGTQFVLTVIEVLGEWIWLGVDCHRNPQHRQPQDSERKVNRGLLCRSARASTPARSFRPIGPSARSAASSAASAPAPVHPPVPAIALPDNDTAVSILRDLVPAARRAEEFLQSLVAAAAESSTPPVALLQSDPEPPATSVNAGSVGRAASRSRPQRVSFRPTPRLLSLGNGSQGGGLHRRRLQQAVCGAATVRQP